MLSYAMVVPENQNTQTKPKDPLYIHPSDNTTQSLVVNFFNGEIFANWKRSVTIALFAKHKLAFIDGSLDQPKPSSPLHTL